MSTAEHQTAEDTVCRWLAEQHEAMLALLSDIVMIDSGSYDKDGVDRVGASLVTCLDSHGIGVEITRLAEYGDVISAMIGPAERQEPPLLLLGHRDTVFPHGEAARRPFQISHGRAYGPGVADMKAGLVMNTFVLAALKRHAGLKGPIRALFTGDEEIASPGSRPIIQQAGAAARAVFNAEPGRPTGNIVIERRGGVFMRFAVSGKSAHSGVEFASGISAIEELAQKVIAVHALNGQMGDITVNVGLVSGGQSVNTVAPHASGAIDLRYTAPHDRDRALAAITDIIEASFVPGTRSSLTVNGEFLAMRRSAESDKLMRLYQDCARKVGFSVQGEATGGCADSGLTASAGTPTLCAVGPVGGKAHSPDEYLEVDSIVPRAQALALALMRLDAAAA